MQIDEKKLFNKKRPLKSSNVGFIIIILKTHHNFFLNYLEPIKKGVKFGTFIAGRKALNYFNNLKRRKYVFARFDLKAIPHIFISTRTDFDS